MARVKKFQTPDGPINPENKQKDKTLVPEQGYTNTTTATMSFQPQQKGISVEGYGNVNWDPEMERFLADKMSSYSGDDRIRDQFSYAMDYAKKGMSRIDPSGRSYGAEDPSLTDKRARGKKYVWGSNENYDRQQAMGQVNKWIQEYAKVKNMPKPVEQKDYTFNLKGEIGKSTGGWNDAYWKSRSLQGKIDDIGTVLERYGKTISEGGDWDDKTHKSSDSTMGKDLYTQLRANYPQMMADYKQMSATWAKDGQVTADEVAGFTNKYGINPFDLLQAAPLTDAEKSKADADAAAKKAKERTEAIAKSKESLGLKGDWRWEGGDTDNDYENRDKWRFYLDGQKANTISDDISSKNIDPSLQNKFFSEGYMMDLGAFTNPARRAELLEYSKKLGLYNEALNDEGNISAVYDKYRGTLGSYYSKYYGDKLTDANAREIGKTPFMQTKLALQHKNLELSPEDVKIGAAKKIYVPASPAYQAQTGKLYEVIRFNNKGQMINSKGQVVRAKNGGTIDFKKINKYQMGGNLKVMTPEELAASKRANSQNLANVRGQLAEQSNRSATTQEVLSDQYELTGADKADIAALGMDVAGLIAGFVPGGSLVSGATGLGSTITGYGANLSRHGFNWGDLKNAAISGAMDAASFIPGVGQAAKFGKIAKMGKGLLKIMQLKGLTDAAGVMKKVIENPSEVNMQEWQTLLGGIKVLQGKAIQGTKIPFTKTRIPGVMDLGTARTGGSSSKIATADGEIKLGVSGKKAGEIVNTKLLKSKSELSTNKTELETLKNTDTSKLTADELNVHNKQVADLEGTINAKETALKNSLKQSGLSDEDAAAVLSADFKTGNTLQNPFTGINPLNWRKPVSKGSKLDIEDTSSTTRVLKDGKLNWAERYGRNFARKAGYVSEADLEAGNFKGYGAEIGAYKSSIDADSKKIKSSNKKIEKTEGEITKDSQKITKSDELMNKVNEFRTQKAEELQKSKDNDLNLRKNLVSKKVINSAKNDISNKANEISAKDAELQAKIAELNNKPKSKKLKDEKTQLEAEKTKLEQEHTDLQNNLATLTNNRKSGLSALRAESKNQVEIQKRLDALDKGAKNISKIKTNTESAIDSKKKSIERLKKGIDKKTKSISDTQSKLSEKQKEMLSDYSSKSIRQGVANNNLTKSAITSGSAIGLAGGAAMISSMRDNVKKDDELRKYDRRILSSMKASLEEELRARPDNNIISANLNRINKILGERVAKKANGGTLVPKFQKPAGTLVQKGTMPNLLPEVVVTAKKPITATSAASTTPVASATPATPAITAQRAENAQVKPITGITLEQVGQQSANKSKINFENSINNRNDQYALEMGKANSTLGKDIMSGLEKTLSPQLLKFAASKATNRKLMDLINKIPRPTGMIAPTSTKLQNVGMSNAIGQLNQIDQQVSAQRPMYSDAKLNALTQLSANQNADQMRNQIWQNLDQQNQQIAAQNAQLSTQDAATAAEITAKNQEAQRAYDTMINQYKQGLIKSDYESVNNLLSEWQQKKEGAEKRIEDIDDKMASAAFEKDYSSKVDSINETYNAQAKAAGKTLEEYLKDPIILKQYNENLATAKSDFRNKYYQSLKDKEKNRGGMFTLYKEGGSLQDKKELEYYKAEMKHISEKDKAFNKMILERMKSHEKVLSLLLKSKY